MKYCKKTNTANIGLVDKSATFEVTLSQVTLAEFL